MFETIDNPLYEELDKAMQDISEDYKQTGES